MAPARKRHWTAEIADIVAGGCECGYEPGDYARSDFELGPDQDKTLPGRVTRERLLDRAAALSANHRAAVYGAKRLKNGGLKKSFRRNPKPISSSRKGAPVEFEIHREDSSEGSIGNSIGKTGGRSEARFFSSSLGNARRPKKQRTTVRSALTLLPARVSPPARRSSHGSRFAPASFQLGENPLQ